MSGAGCGDWSFGGGGYGPGSWPSACWRPYSASSPFNSAVPANPAISADSTSVAAALASLNTDFFVSESKYFDGGHPTFWSRPSDPLVTLRSAWGGPLDGLQVRVPAQATPAGGFSFGSGWPNQHDSHLTIVDQSTGWEYDMWNVQSLSDGVLSFTNGGKTRIDGAGLGSAAVAANFGNLAGVIRLEELKAGVINHALVVSVPNVYGHVYPACQDNNNNSGPGTGIPKLGARLWLDMSASEINALPIPAYRKTIAMALARYGAYVEDSGNPNLTFNIESPQTYAAYGRHDWNEWAASLGVTETRSPDGLPAYGLNLSGIPFASKLRVIDPPGSC